MFGLGVIGLCAVAVAQVLGAEVMAIANSLHAAPRQRGSLACVTSGSLAIVPSTIHADVVILTADEWDAVSAGCRARAAWR